MGVAAIAEEQSNNANPKTPDLGVWIAVGVVVIGAVVFLLLKVSAKRDNADKGPAAPKDLTRVPPVPQSARETPVPAVEPEYVSALYIPATKTLPPNGQWENRFEVKSTTSNRRYVIAQHKDMRHWSCSCPGWTQYRHCKHLESVGLPPYERPHEVHLDITGVPAPAQSPKSYPAELSDFPDIDLSSAVPPHYVVFDLETTGLDPMKHDIVEIGAIRVNPNSNNHDTFHALVKPNRRITKFITEKTGINQEMVDRDGEPLERVIADFAEFIGNLPLVSYGADFDMRFLRDAAKRHDILLNNRAACALNMARKAWPFLKSHKLGDVASAGNFDQNFKCSTPDEGTHRALGDCKRTLMIYVAAATVLGYNNGQQAQSAGTR